MTGVPATRAAGMLTRSRARRAAVPAMGTRSRAGTATDRDLGSARASATLKTTTTKTATAAASVGAGIHIQKRKKPEGASEAAGTTLSEATEILTLKKEAFGATRLWRQMGVPGALERFVKAREEEAQQKRRKMVVKTRLPEAVIDAMKLHPYCCIEPMADEDLAKKTESFRELYAVVRFVDDKMNAYEQALIKQHDSKGYAEDETEVSDDEQVQVD